jgi:hypothetical protein
METGIITSLLPIIIGDKDYPCLNWLMVPYDNIVGVQQIVLQKLFNKKLCRGRLVTKNAFGMVKKTFREFLDITDLDVRIILDVFSTCCLLHNLILRGKQVDVDQLMEVLDAKASVNNLLRRWRARLCQVVPNFRAPENVNSQLEAIERDGDQQRRNIELYLGDRFGEEA